MKYVNAVFGWLWRRKLFFLVTLASALFFFAWLFPFGDLSQVVTTKISEASGRQVYMQFESLDLHLVPTPSISGTGVSIETALPPLQASWVKITPSLLSMLFSLPTFIKANGGDPEAQKAAAAKLGVSLAAEGLLGADVDLSIRPGKKSERGAERSRVSLMVENLDLKEVQDWSDLPIKMQGRAHLSTDMQIAPDFQDQPEGEYTIRADKFVMPANTLLIPFEGASMPVNLPGLSLANLTLKGRMVNGSLFIEDGKFGDSRDPLSGRIKGKVDVKFISSRGSIQPVPGQYALTVDLSASKAFEKEFSYLGMLLGNVKTATPTGSRYLFQIKGMVGGAFNISPQSTY